MNAQNVSALNVLFIVADDFLPMISDLHADRFRDVRTPHLNAFMKETLVLANSHVQQAVCAPSRTSVLFGRRPDTMRVWSSLDDYDEMPCNYDKMRCKGCLDCMTVPGLFKDAGYVTVGIGKVFDIKITSNRQDPRSWSYPEHSGVNWFYGKDPYRSGEELSWQSVNEKSTGQCQDSQVRDKAVDWLRNLTAAQSSKPWFLAVGFMKPHLPWVCPKEFYNLYNSRNVTLATNPFAPWDMPFLAPAETDEILQYSDLTGGGIDELKA